MSDEAIRGLARRAGIAVDWTDAASQTQHVSRSPFSPLS